MDCTLRTQNILSYCTGIRGIERGLERTGIPIKTIAFLEIEAFIVGNLVAQMEVGLLDPAPIWTNIKTFDAKPFHNKIHGIIGGYPCQPFSHAGERRGIEDERHLFPYILEQIEIIRPEWVYFENVSGHLSMGYEEVRRSLSGLGYRIEEGIFTAQEVGAPHKRERLFIFGVMENAGVIGWGRRYFGNQRGGEYQIKTTGSAPTMGNTDGINQQYDWPTEPPEHIENRGSSNTMAYANGGGSKIRGDKSSTQFIIENNTSIPLDNAGGNRLQQDNPIQTRRHSTELTSEVDGVDNAINTGLQGHAGNDSRAQRWQRQERSITASGLFPAGQGNFQYEWEESRTTQSSMEYTIDGYNFTEDLHRAIGNSVVEQTAELAFLTLLKKHIKNMD